MIADTVAGRNLKKNCFMSIVHKTVETGIELSETKESFYVDTVRVNVVEIYFKLHVKDGNDLWPAAEYEQEIISF